MRITITKKTEEERVTYDPMTNAPVGKVLMGAISSDHKAIYLGGTQYIHWIDGREPEIKDNEGNLHGPWVLGDSPVSITFDNTP